VLGPQAEPQLRMTIKNALAAGATKREIAEVIWQMSMFGGVPAMQKALEIAQSVFAEPRLRRKTHDRRRFSPSTCLRHDHGAAGLMVTIAATRCIRCCG
jgi:hypothetical protein